MPEVMLASPLYAALSAIAVVSYAGYVTGSGVNVIPAAITATDKLLDEVRSEMLSLTLDLGIQAILAAEKIKEAVSDGLKSKRDLQKYQVVVMEFSGNQRKDKSFRKVSPYLTIMSGGDACRIVGAYLAPQNSTELLQWFGRADYHGHWMFPQYKYTIHYHLPPNMDMHHFLWPQFVDVP